MQVFQHQILSDYILLLKSPIYLLADGILVDLAILVEKLWVESLLKIGRSNQVSVRLDIFCLTFQGIPEAVRNMLDVVEHLMHPLEGVTYLLHD